MTTHPVPSWTKAASPRDFAEALIDWDRNHGLALSGGPPYVMKHLITLAQSVEAIDNVPPGLLCAIAEVESNWNPLALGDKGRSYGLCQVQLRTARGDFSFKGRAEALLHPVVSLGLASAYLQRQHHWTSQLSRSPLAWRMAIAAYNCGPRRVKAAFKGWTSASSLYAWSLAWKSLPASTQAYVERVEWLQAQYAAQHALDDQASIDALAKAGLR